MALAKSVLRTTGELCITVGALLLLFVAWQLWWTDVGANRVQAGITADLQQGWGDEEAAPADVAPVAQQDLGPPPAEPAPPAGEAFAIIRVPRFGADYQPRPIQEGTSLDLLDKGVGHYVGTALPGEVGNFALAGHRVTYGKPFNKVAELQPGDPIVVETANAWYIYRMRSTLIVTPDRVDVVAPVPEQPNAVPTERLLTMTTCNPMYSAKERFIVHAVLDRWQPKSAGDPVELTETPTPTTGG